MKDQEPRPATALRKIAAWAWVLVIIFVAGVLLVPRRSPDEVWKSGGTLFPGGSVPIYFLLLAAVAGALIAAVLHSGKGKDAIDGLALKEGHPHPGITMHRLRVGGNVGGFIFAVGIVLICLVGIPTMWFFLVLALVVGLAIAMFLRRRKGLKIVTIAGAGNRPL